MTAKEIMDVKEMLTFTDKEMICFNSILGGKNIDGIQLRMPPIGDKKEYIQSTLEKLKVKGMVNEKNQLTELGKIPLKVLYEYKKAKKYVHINYLKIAIIDEQNVVMFQREKDKTYMLPIEKEILLEAILKEYEYLKQEQEKIEIAKREITVLSYEKWLDSLDLMDQDTTDMIGLSKKEEDKVVDRKIYYWDKNGMLLYDIEKQKRKRIITKEVRETIKTMLEI